MFLQQQQQQQQQQQHTLSHVSHRFCVQQFCGSVSVLTCVHVIADYLVLLGLGLVWLLLLCCVSVSLKDMDSFDPYTILQVDPGATKKEIRKAFLSMA
jgi:hypothetical protein